MKRSSLLKICLDIRNIRKRSATVFCHAFGNVSLNLSKRIAAIQSVWSVCRVVRHLCADSSPSTAHSLLYAVEFQLQYQWLQENFYGGHRTVHAGGETQKTSRLLDSNHQGQHRSACGRNHHSAYAVSQALLERLDAQ